MMRHRKWVCVILLLLVFALLISVRASIFALTHLLTKELLAAVTSQMLKPAIMMYFRL